MVNLRKRIEISSIIKQLKLSDMKNRDIFNNKLTGKEEYKHL